MSFNHKPSLCSASRLPELVTSPSATTAGLVSTFLMVTRGLKESAFAQQHHSSWVMCLEDRDTEAEGEKTEAGRQGRGTAPGSGGAVTSGTLPQPYRDVLYISRGKISKCKYQLYILGNLRRWLYRTTAPSAVQETLNQTLPLVPHLNILF